MSHGNFPDAVGMFADVLEEVLEVGHGGLLDTLTQLRDGLTHDLRETVLGHARQVRVLQLLQGLQRRVVPEGNKRKGQLLALFSILLNHHQSSFWSS